MSGGRGLCPELPGGGDGALGGQQAVLACNVFFCFRLPFPPGDRVTFNGKECMCQKCSVPTAAGSSSHLSQGLWSK